MPHRRAGPPRERSSGQDLAEVVAGALLVIDQKLAHGEGHLLAGLHIHAVIGIGDDAQLLAAAVCLIDRDLGTHMLALQVLIYPCVTMLYTGNPGYRFDIGQFEICEEQRELIDPLISIGRPQSEDDPRIEMEDVYLPSREAAYHPYVSPMLALSHRGLPRALCVSAGFDGLRLQTEYYASQLRQNGCQVRAIRYNGVSHAFLDKLGFVPQSEDLCIEIAKELRAL